jgi:hypothetical protein
MLLGDSLERFADLIVVTLGLSVEQRLLYELA